MNQAESVGVISGLLALIIVLVKELIGFIKRRNGDYPSTRELSRRIDETKSEIMQIDANTRLEISHMKMDSSKRAEIVTQLRIDTAEIRTLLERLQEAHERRRTR